jgi:hypothetical protein
MRANTAVVAILLTASLLATSVACGRMDRQTPDQQRAEIAAFEKERAELRARIDELSAKDPRLEGMPQTSVRVGVPTSLATDIIQRLMSGFVDQVTIELKNLHVKKSGRIKKVVTLGEYNLHVTVNRVTGKVKTGKPNVTFGGNKVAIAMPVSIVSGSGRATIHFKWDGKNISGAVCGDQDITQEVRGGVWPDRYPVSGGLFLTATAKQILAEPVFPLLRINLKINPSAESWAAAQKILDDKTGVCGFVLDKVNVLSHVRRLIDKGFNIRLPTEKIKPLALPVGINPSMDVRGQTVALGIKISEIAITKQMIWLGSDVTVAVGDEAAAKLAAEAVAEAAASKGARKPAAKTVKPQPPSPATPVGPKTAKPPIPKASAPVIKKVPSL